MLSQEQIDFFHQNGFLIMRQMFQGEELRLLKQAVDEVQAQGVAKEGADLCTLPVPKATPSTGAPSEYGRGEIFFALSPSSLTC